MLNYNSITLPLHSGHPPNYLIRRMIKLSGSISKVLIDEYGTLEFLKRISDPLWFQAFGCVLGFDWHSSGVTTVVMAVLKQSLTADLHGILIAGGKGINAKNTLDEINVKCNSDFNFSDNQIDRLLYASKMSAKVDNSAIQDNYFLYHHNILFDCDGNWAIVQQGLNNKTDTARRYHWFSKDLKDGFILEPHSGIISDDVHDVVLDMTSKDSLDNQKTVVDIVKGRMNCDDLILSVNRLLSKRKETVLDSWFDLSTATLKSKPPDFSPRYFDVDNHYAMPKKIDWSTLKRVYDTQPSNYEEFLSIKGVGPATVRALSLIGELIFGSQSSWRDPIKYCFAHGGKDGVPYPINRKSYDESVRFLDSAIEGANISRDDKMTALKKLSVYNNKIYSITS